MAFHAWTLDEERDLYAKALATAEQALGPRKLKDYAGHFWGILETRPYMRARAGLATAYLKLGDPNTAIGHFRAMLVLNPGDNQGIRYVLAGVLLCREDIAGLKALLADYPYEGSLYWLYTRALLAFREGGNKRRANALARAAWSANAHVPGILAGTMPPVAIDPEYIVVGGPAEAMVYVNDYAPGWIATPGAIAWLTKIAAACAAKARPGRVLH